MLSINEITEIFYLADEFLKEFDAIVPPIFLIPSWYRVQVWNTLFVRRKDRVDRKETFR